MAAFLWQLAQDPLSSLLRRNVDLQVYLSESDVAAVVEGALLQVADAEPLLIARIRHDVMRTIWRQPLDSS